MAGGLINVRDPDTNEIGSIPASQFQEAMQQGYQQASAEETTQFLKEQKYGTTAQQALTGVEGALSAATFGGSTALERALGVPAEDIQARREINPTTHMVGQGAGLLGSSLLLPGGGAAGLLEKVGASAAEAVGLGAAETGLQKIGSSAINQFAQNALFQSGDEVSKMLASDPDQSVQSAAVNIGLSGLLGSGLGAGTAGASSLWAATNGGRVGQILKAISDRAGGIENSIPDAVREAMQASGIEIPPEIQASFSKYPELQHSFQTLQESSTHPGLKAQESLRGFKEEANNSILQSMGKSLEDVDRLSNLSDYEVGSDLRATLADNLKKDIDPISEMFTKVKERFKGTELDDGMKASIADNIAQLSEKEGYLLSPSSPQSQLVNRVLKELPNIKTLDDLTKYQSIIGGDTAGNPELYRVGKSLKNIFRENEANLITQKLGAEAPELLGDHAMARAAYSDAMKVIDDLNDRLHVGRYNGPASFIKALKEMSPEDVTRRLLGKKDVDLQQLLSERFPQVAEQVRDYHLSSLLKSAAQRAVPGETISGKVLLSSVEKMSPELRQFTFSPEALEKMKSIQTLLDAIPSKVNTSGTAKALDSLWSNVPGTAAGMATMLLGHNPVLALLVGGLTKFLGRDIPDAAKLGLLKFLGSNQQIDAGGFKAMVDFIASAQKSESLINKAVRGVVQGGSLVLPETVMPSPKKREKLDQMIQQIQLNPGVLANAGGKMPYYMPEHGRAMAQFSANAVNYLNGLRPTAKKPSPLDQPIEPSKAQENAYHRALDVAEQPLFVFKHVKEGTLQAQDVVTLRTVHPALYTRLSQKLFAELSANPEGGKNLPYKTKMGLSLFLGQPLDSTLTPQGIMAAQPKPSAPPPPSQQSLPASKASSLSKMPMASLTPLQSREKDRLK